MNADACVVVDVKDECGVVTQERIGVLQTVVRCSRRLVSIGDTLSQLQCVDLLDLQFNRFRCVPSAVFSLRTVTELNVRFTPSKKLHSELLFRSS
jgi:hypothetical protein